MRPYVWIPPKTGDSFMPRFGSVLPYAEMMKNIANYANSPGFTRKTGITLMGLCHAGAGLKKRGGNRGTKSFLVHLKSKLILNIWFWESL